MSKSNPALLCFIYGSRCGIFPVHRLRSSFWESARLAQTDHSVSVSTPEKLWLRPHTKLNTWKPDIIKEDEKTCIKQIKGTEYNEPHTSAQHQGLVGKNSRWTAGEKIMRRRKQPTSCLTMLHNTRASLKMRCLTGFQGQTLDHTSWHPETPSFYPSEGEVKGHGPSLVQSAWVNATAEGSSFKEPRVNPLWQSCCCGGHLGSKLAPAAHAQSRNMINTSVNWEKVRDLRVMKADLIFTRSVGPEGRDSHTNCK